MKRLVILAINPGSSESLPIHRLTRSAMVKSSEKGKTREKKSGESCRSSKQLIDQATTKRCVNLRLPVSGHPAEVIRESYQSFGHPAEVQKIHEQLCPEAC
jgi:hypothetical protein